jgi:hypothetical protein
VLSAGAHIEGSSQSMAHRVIWSLSGHRSLASGPPGRLGFTPSVCLIPGLVFGRAYARSPGRGRACRSARRRQDSFRNGRSPAGPDRPSRRQCSAATTESFGRPPEIPREDPARWTHRIDCRPGMALRQRRRYRRARLTTAGPDAPRRPNDSCRSGQGRAQHLPLCRDELTFGVVNKYTIDNRYPVDGHGKLALLKGRGQ